MGIEFVQNLIDKIRGKKVNPYKKLNAQKMFKYNKKYGKIYFPHYNLECEIQKQKPNIYNKDGQKMDAFFLRDIHGCHIPYGTNSKYFLWDRFNIGLDTHFYTHNSMLETMGKPDRKYGLLIESEAIVPEDYKIFDKNKGLEKDFDLIFTYNEKILNKIDNAKYFPACSCVWYGAELGDNTILTDKAFENKTKDISMICSDKIYSKYHQIRHNFAHKVKNLDNVNILGKFDSGQYLKFKSDSLKNYRYQIAVENGVYPYYFTEKIMDCFASMTVPIYLGAPKIDDFFNPDGIIKISANNIDNIEEILKQCNEKDYEQRLPAIIDNYNRVLKYVNLDDYLYEEFFKTAGNISTNFSL